MKTLTESGYTADPHVYTKQSDRTRIAYSRFARRVTKDLEMPIRYTLDDDEQPQVDFESTADS